MHSYTFSQMANIGAAFEGKEPLFTQESTEDDLVQVIVVVSPQKSELPIDELQGRGFKLQRHLALVDGVVGQVAPELLHELRTEGYTVHRDRPEGFEPHIPHGDSPSVDGSPPNVDPVAMTGVDQLHAAGNTGDGKVVALLDSGFDHPGFNLVAWHDVRDGQPAPHDEMGHGTHLAGLLHAAAPDVGIVAVRVMDQTNNSRDHVVQGIEWVLQNKDVYGIDVISISLQIPSDSVPHELDVMCQHVQMAVNAGLHVTVAAGNDGPDPHTIGSPAEAPAALTVGAVLDEHTVSEFSARGPTDANFHKPDVMAPGEYLESWCPETSTMWAFAQQFEQMRQMTDGQLVAVAQAVASNQPTLFAELGLPANIFSLPAGEAGPIIRGAIPDLFPAGPGRILAAGTSCSAPQVAGVIACLLQASPGHTPADLKSALMEGAASVGAYGVDVQGAGLVDAAAALNALHTSAMIDPP